MIYFDQKHTCQLLVVCWQARYCYILYCNGAQNFSFFCPQRGPFWPRFALLEITVVRTLHERAEILVRLLVSYARPNERADRPEEPSQNSRRIVFHPLESESLRHRSIVRPVGGSEQPIPNAQHLTAVLTTAMV